MKDFSTVRFADLTTKKDRIACLRWRLAHDHNWALAGLGKIYAAQTADEQEAEMTSEHNGVGFTGVDAEILSSFAKQHEERGFLTPRQMLTLFKMMPKYAGQLEKISKRG